VVRREVRTSKISTLPYLVTPIYRYEPNPERGCGYIFGYAATAEFLQENKITSIIRAHEVEQTGYKEIFFRRKERVYPMVITVFSAPNYCGMYRVCHPKTCAIFDLPCMEIHLLNKENIESRRCPTVDALNPTDYSYAK
jgi:hypothetical protein